MKLMKRLILAVLLSIATPLLAATITVDPGCTVAHTSGTYSSICDATGADNPTTDLDVAIAAATCGDTINVRGVHGAHGSCTAGFDGKVYAPVGDGAYDISGKSCSGNPIIIQASGWTAVGNGEVVYGISALAPDNTVTDCSGTCGWTQCPANCATACNGQTITSGKHLGQLDCDKIWYASLPTTGIAHALKDDMTPTYRVSTYNEVTNNNSAYIDGRCVLQSWRRCDPSNDLGRDTQCPATGDQCTGSSPEVDCFLSGTTLWCQWGTGTDAPGGTNRKRPFIYNDRGQSDFFFIGYPVNSIGITVRGFTLLGGKTPPIVVRCDSACTAFPSEITFQDMRVFYVVRATGASDYAFQSFRAAGVSMSDFELSYINSEAIHTDPRPAAGAMNLDLSRGWIHHIGQTNVLGLLNNSTSSGMIIGGNGTTGDGNYTGSVFDNLLIDHIKAGTGGSPGNGINFETSVSNIQLSNSIVYKPDGATFQFQSDFAAFGAIDSNNVFNNLFLYPVNGRFGCSIYIESARAVTNNKFFNNTVIVDGTNVGMCDDSASKTGVTGNLFRNNIWQTAGGRAVSIVNNTDASNHFQNNLVYAGASPPNPVVSWLNVNYACADVDTIESGNKECANPVFVDAVGRNFHIQTTSPAKDAGTAVGMPAARTTDINNTLAVQHGFITYADANPIQGGVWDIGADEFSSGGSGTVTLDVSGADAPDPVNAGNSITYTFTYHNTGSASASNVAIANQLPANATYVSCTGGTGCVFFPNGSTYGTIAWDIGTVAASGSGSVTVTVSVSSSLGAGSIIRNDSYGIASDETGQVLGSPVVTTTVSSSTSRRGRIFPGKR